MKGLSREEVIRSREKNGSNEIPDSKPTTFLKEFLETFKDPMIRVLLVIAALMIVMFILGYSAIYEPLGTIVAIVIVALVTARTGVASDTKYRELKSGAEREQCRVWRDETLTMVDINDIVVGDYVMLQAGDKVPADGILIDGKMQIDNSALNGEAEECTKTGDSSADFPEEITGDSFVDSTSLFRGAIVLDGDGVLLVRKTGLQTMTGKMASEMQGEEPPSPLQVKLARLAKQISKFGYIGAIVIAVFYFAYMVLHAGGPAVYFAASAPSIIQDIVEAVSLAVIIIVCAVPEGLPLMISLVLMQNTSRMLDRNVLVRKAIGIETAGSLNILFTDKTGTITMGHLQVVEFFTADGRTAENWQDNDTIRDMMHLAIARNTQASFDTSHHVIGGNMTDRALLEFIGEDGFDSVNGYTVSDSQPFSSSLKFSQAHVCPPDGSNEKTAPVPAGGMTFYKGAPERLLEHASFYLDADGRRQPLDMTVIQEKINALASRAMRVLAFGYSGKPMESGKINDDLTIIGLVGIRDDVRPEARTAIGEVLSAGIQIVMITGDRIDTASAIARDSGLMTSDDDVALTSAQLNKMTDDEIREILPRLRVIARALPTDKSRMVRICQSMNLVTGMTGDGVNDAPALKQSDVGFAMGAGTEAAKEASKIVILDNNFRSIKDAILYGRTIYHNILKFCKFQLAINVTAVIVSAIAPFFGVNEPLKVVHLLFVNLVMDSLGAIMLGNEPAFDSYMQEKPRRRDEPIVSKDMMVQIVVMGIWLTILSFLYLKLPVFLHIQHTEPKLLTGYFVLFIAAALFNGFNVRDDGFHIFRGLSQNKGFLRMMIAILLIQAAIVCAPMIPHLEWIGEMFSCTPFPPAGWLTVYLLALTVIPVDLIRKAVTGSGKTSKA